MIQSILEYKEASSLTWLEMAKRFGCEYGQKACNWNRSGWKVIPDNKNHAEVLREAAEELRDLIDAENLRPSPSGRLMSYETCNKLEEIADLIDSMPKDVLFSVRRERVE